MATKIRYFPATITAAFNTAGYATIAARRKDVQTACQRNTIVEPKTEIDVRQKSVLKA
ncbi:hypothetical protein [uncultured Bartonella sp.]|uniref:hypothetical protein n=1 Tax=uncultured Bartonella sp. TaxID=104108 RepID=UPI002635751A|nr:hypothetical protein [uncultured Bartonella sp.]